jgi:hypothetical protein
MERNMGAEKKTNTHADNVEQTTVKGRRVWRIQKKGHVLKVTTKVSSERSMKRTNERYSEALKSLANR